MRIADTEIGGGARLALIAGLNVLEGEAEALDCARHVQTVSERHGLSVVFKASFDKANRTRVDAFRGPGLRTGLEILAAVKSQTGLPVLTDVHEPGQAEQVARIADCLQVPAFLCRQTDLVVACAKTGKAVNVKKGQFVAPRDAVHAVEKLRSAGATDVMLTERGVSFGYGDLVADMRSLVEMRAFAPVCFDATHAVQRPGALDGASGGERRFVAPLARAAVATGVDAIFLETHPEPERAPVDSGCQLDFEALDRLVGELVAIEGALRDVRAEAVAR